MSAYLRRAGIRRRGSGLQRNGAITADQLEDSRRPLLFSLLPRMLRPDGSMPKLLQRAFGYLDEGRGRAPVIIVSSERWDRALATSRRLAGRRARDRKP